MAATFSFTTTPILSGHSMRIYSTSTNWSEYVPGNVSTVVLTIKTLDGDDTLVGNTDTFTKSLVAADLNGDFQIDITALELFGIDEIIPDDIYNVKIATTGTDVWTYNSDEVFYYNAWKTKSEICYNAVNFICDINCLEIKYSSMVNILYQGLISDIAVANTSGVYEKIDIFNRLAQQQ